MTGVMRTQNNKFAVIHEITVRPAVFRNLNLRYKRTGMLY